MKDKNSCTGQVLSKAIFIDRDGVINKWVKPQPPIKPEDHYITSWSQFEFLPGVFEAFKLIKDTDYIPMVVSNQSGIDKGLVDYDTVASIFWSMGVSILDEVNIEPIFLFCPHTPDAGCACRKPKPGMIYKYAVDYNLDLSQCWMIGDQESDLLAGYAAGISNLIWIMPLADDLKYSIPIIHPAYQPGIHFNPAEPTIPMVKVTDTIMKTSLLEAIKLIVGFDSEKSA